MIPGGPYQSMDQQGVRASDDGRLQQVSTAQLLEKAKAQQNQSTLAPDYQVGSARPRPSYSDALSPPRAVQRFDTGPPQQQQQHQPTHLGVAFSQEQQQYPTFAQASSMYQALSMPAEMYSRHPSPMGQPVQPYQQSEVRERQGCKGVGEAIAYLHFRLAHLMIA